MGADDVYTCQDPLRLPAGTIDECGSHAATVFLEPPGTQRLFHRNPPRFVDDPDDTGLFGSFAPATIICPPAFVATACEAELVGFRTVLCADRTFLTDDSLDEEWASQDPFAQMLRRERTGLSPTGDANHFRLDRTGRRTYPVEGTAVLLTSAEPSNYGSWLFRVLPKLTALRHFAGLSPKFIVYCGPRSYRESLTVLGLPAGSIISQDVLCIYRSERLLVPSMRNNQAYIDPESLALFADLRERFGGLPQPGRRIYVSRLRYAHSSGTSRVMRNERELVDRLCAQGIEIVEPETLDFVGQIRTFSTAEMVIGPSGSGMFNAVFCHPGTRLIDIESEPHWIHAHTSLFASCGLDYGLFVGSTDEPGAIAHHQPWRVNIEALLSRINGFSRRPTPATAARRVAVASP